MQAPLSTVPAPPVPEQAPVQVNTAYTGAQSAVSESCIPALISLHSTTGPGLEAYSPQEGPLEAMAVCSATLPLQTITNSCMQVVICISGQGVTPFTAQKQQQLINIFVDATAGNVSASQFSVLLVSSAYSSRRRSMLQVPIVVSTECLAAHCRA